MRKEAPAEEASLGVKKGLLRQIREEMQASYQPRDRNKSTEQAEAAQPASGELVELRAALAALCSSYALVGQTPPEPPTFRGRMGAQLVKVVQRLLFWYTPQIVHFQYSALRAFESALRAFEVREDEFRRVRRELEAAAAAAMSRAGVLERRRCKRRSNCRSYPAPSRHSGRGRKTCIIWTRSMRLCKTSSAAAARRSRNG